MDDAGNLTTRDPAVDLDEQFVDNADPGYAETVDPGRPGPDPGTMISRQVTISPVPRASAEEVHCARAPQLSRRCSDPHSDQFAGVGHVGRSSPEPPNWSPPSFPEGTLSPGWGASFELELGAAEELRLVMKAGNFRR